MPWKRFRKKRDMPSGLWVKCPSCGATLFNKDLAQNLEICSHCGHHLRMGARARIAALCDEGSFQEKWTDIHTVDRLSFVDKLPYPEKLHRSAAKCGLPEAAIAGVGTLRGQPLALCCLDFFFMGGSMGTVVGEKVTRTLEFAADEKLPAVVVSCSGGARMHEGALSLMQMGKTSAAVARLHAAGGLYISVLANPTTGGVMASFAGLGDLIFAEPGALIGFAGPRVIQETLRTELPDGFQTSEFLLDRGFIDRIVSRSDLADELSRTLQFLWTYTDEQLERYRPPEPVASEEAGEDDPEAAEEPVEGEEASVDRASADEG